MKNIDVIKQSPGVFEKNTAVRVRVKKTKLEIPYSHGISNIIFWRQFALSGLKYLKTRFRALTDFASSNNSNIKNMDNGKAYSNFISRKCLDGWSRQSKTIKNFKSGDLSQLLELQKNWKK